MSHERLQKQFKNLKTERRKIFCSSAYAILFGFIIFLSTLSSKAFALPSGYSVESGNVSFDSSVENNLVISASDHAIINFDSFSIAQNELVRFVQPFDTASVLGRVTGNSQTDIFGSLYANGQFIFINPNGINIHDTANIQVASLIASTLDIQNAMYLNNELTFEKRFGSNPGKIFNEADIAAKDGGHIVFLSEAIENHGALTARLGSVALGVGEKATVSFDSQGLINLVIDKGLAQGLQNGQAAIQNDGSLVADGGRIVLTVKMLNDLFDSIVNVRGIVQANRAVERNGQIFLIANGPVHMESEISGTDFMIGKDTALYAGHSDFKIERDWINQGQFHGEQSTVEFFGPLPATVQGNNEFYNLTVVTPDKEVAFEAGKTAAVKGNLQVVGAPDQGPEEFYVKFLSTEKGKQWTLDVQSGHYFLDRVSIQDGYSIHFVDIPKGVDAGNNINFTIDPVWDGGGAGNNWSTANNWDGNAVPVNAEAVTFNETSTKDATIDDVGTWTGGTLTIAAGYSGTITKNVAITTAAYSQAGGTFNAGSTAMTVTTFSLTGGTFTSTSGTLDATSTFTISGAPTFTHNSGTVKFSGGAATITDSTGVAFNHLTFAGASAAKTIASNLTVAGNLTENGDTSGSTVADGSARTITITGNFVQENNTFGDANLKIKFVGDATHTMTKNGGTFAAQILVNDATETINLATAFVGNSTSSLTISAASTFDAKTFAFTTGNFSQSAGTFTGGSGAHSFLGTFAVSGGTYTSTSSTMSVTGAFTLSGGALTATSNTMTASSTFTISGVGTTFTHNSGTVKFDGSTATITDSTGVTFYNLTFAGASAVKTVASNLTVANTLAENGDTAGSTVADASARTISVSGNFTQENNTFGNANLTLKMTGTAAQTIAQNGGTFSGNITIDKSSQTATLSTAMTVGNALTMTLGTLDTNTKVLTVSGAYSQSGGTFTGSTAAHVFGSTYSLTGGTFSASTGIHSIAGNVTISGAPTFTHNSGTIRFNGGVATITDSTGVTFNNVTFAGASAAKTIASNLTIAGTLTENGDTAGSTVADGSARTISLSGNFTQTNDTFGDANLTLKMTGTAAQTFTHTAGTLSAQVNINKASGTVTLGDATTISSTGSLAIVSGTLDTNTKVLTVTGAYSQSGGTFTGSTGAHVFGSTYSLTGGTFSASTGIHSIAGNVTISGAPTFTHNSGTIRFNGGVATITDSTGVTFYNLTFAGTSAIKTVASNLTVANTLTENGDTGGTTVADASARTISVSGNFTQENDTFGNANLTLKMTGTASQNITKNGGGVYSGKLAIDKSSGTATLTTAMTVGNVFTMTAGTLALGSNTLTLSNTYTHTAGTVTATSGLIDATSTFTQAAGSIAEIKFSGGAATLTQNGGTITNMTLNATSATKTIASNFSVIGNLTNTGDTGGTTVADGSARAITLTGNFSQTVNTFGDANLSLKFTGNVTHTLNKTGGTFSAQINLDDAGETVQMISAFSISSTGSITISTSTFDTNALVLTLGGAYSQSGGTFTGSTGAHDFDGTFSLTGGTYSASTGIHTYASTFTISGAPTFTHNSGTTKFDGGTATITDSTGVTFGNVTFAGVSVTKTIASNLTVAGNLVENGDTGGVTASDGSARTISVSGTFDQENDTFGDSNLTVRMTGTSAQNITKNGGTYSGKLTIDKTSGTATLTTAMTVGNVFTMTQGTLALGSNTLTLSNTYTHTAGTVTATTGLIDATSTFTQAAGSIAEIKFSGGAANLTQNGGTITNATFAGTSAAKTIKSNFAISGNLTENGDTAGSTVADGVARTITLSGNFTQQNDTFGDANLTLTMDGASKTFTKNAGTFRAQLNVTGSVSLGAATTFDAVSTVTTAVGGTLNLNAKNWTMTDITFANNGTIQLQGSETITGLTQDTDSGTWTYVGDGDAAADTFTIKDFGATDYFNLKINSTDSTTDIFQLGGNLVVAGTFTLTDGIYSPGSNNTTVNGTSTLRITGGSFNNGSGTVTDNGLTAISGGTFDAGTGAVNWSGATFTLSGGTYKSGTGVNTFNAAVTISGGTFSIQSTDTSKIVKNSTWTNSGGTIQYVAGSAAVSSVLSSLSGYYNLTVNSAGSTYSLDGNITVAGALSVAAGTLNASGKTVTVTGTATVNGGTYQASTAAQTFNGGLTVSGGTFTGSTGAVSGSGLVVSSGTFTAPSSFTITSGSLTHSGGTLTPGTGTITFNGTDGSISTTASLYNLTYSGSTGLYFGSNLTVTNNLTISSGFAQLSGYNLTMTGATLSNDGTVRVRGSETLTGITQDTDSGTWLYTGDGDSAADTFTVKDFGSVDYYNLTISSTDSNDTYQLGGSSSVAGAMSVTTGIFNANANTNTATGVVTVSGGTYQASTATQTFNGGLTVSGGTFTGSSGTVDVNGTVTLSSGTLTAPSGTFTISTNWARSGGTFTQGTGTVTLDTTTTSVISGSTTFYNLTSTTGSKQITFTAGTTQTITNTLTLNGSAGSLITLRSSSSGTQWNIDAQGTRSLTYLDVKDSYNANGTAMSPTTSTNSGNNTGWTFAATTFTWAGTSSSDWATAANWDLGYIPNSTDNIIIASSSNAATLDQNRTMNNLTISSGGTLSLAGYNITVSGTFSNSGTFQLQGAETVSLTQDTTAGTWKYIGNGNGSANTYTIIDNGSTDYYNLVIAATDSGDVFQSAAAKTIGNNLTLSSGVLNINGSNMAVSGTFSQTGGTFRLQGGETYTGITPSTTAGTWEFKGDGDSAADTYTLPDFGATDYYNLIINPTDSNDTFQSGAAKSIAGTFTLSAGTYNANAFATTVTGLTTVGGGTYTSSTGTQTFNNGLTISGGTFTGSTGTVDVNGVFTLSSGTFTAPAAGASFTVSDDFLATGGTFTHNSGKVTLDTTTEATVDAPSGGLTFYDLTIATAGKTVKFTGGDTFVIAASNTFVSTGAAGNLIYLTSTNTTQYTFDIPTNAHTITNTSFAFAIFVNYLDSDGATNGGNNTKFSTPPSVAPTVAASAVTAIADAIAANSSTSIAITVVNLNSVAAPAIPITLTTTTASSVSSTSLFAPAPTVSSTSSGFASPTNGMTTTTSEGGITLGAAAPVTEMSTVQETIGEGGTKTTTKTGDEKTEGDDTEEKSDGESTEENSSGKPKEPVQAKPAAAGTKEPSISTVIQAQPVFAAPAPVVFTSLNDFSTQVNVDEGRVVVTPRQLAAATTAGLNLSPVVVLGGERTTSSGNGEIKTETLNLNVRCAPALDGSSPATWSAYRAGTLEPMCKSEAPSNQTIVQANGEFISVSPEGIQRISNNGELFDQKELVSGAFIKSEDLTSAFSKPVVAISEQGKIVVIGEGVVNTFDPRGATQSIVTGGGLPANAVMTGQTVVVTLPADGQISITNLETHQQTSFDIPGAPTGIVLSPNSPHECYVTNTTQNKVQLIDIRTGEIKTNISVGQSPTNAVLDPKSGLIYVANTGGDTVSVINPSSNTVVNQIAVGSSPRSLSVGNGSVAVACAASHRVDLIEGGKVVKTVDTGAPVVDALLSGPNIGPTVSSSVGGGFGGMMGGAVMTPSGPAIAAMPVMAQGTGGFSAPTGLNVTRPAHESTAKFGGAAPAPNVGLESSFSIGKLGDPAPENNLKLLTEIDPKLLKQLREEGEDDNA